MLETPLLKTNICNDDSKFFTNPGCPVRRMSTNILNPAERLGTFERDFEMMKPFLMLNIDKIPGCARAD
jgi:hypothetical protein